MTKTSENTGKTPKTLALIACLGALPLFFGATGCSTPNPSYTLQPQPPTVETTVDLIRAGPTTRLDWRNPAYGLYEEQWNITSIE
jgi:hypothetical protein